MAYDKLGTRENLVWLHRKDYFECAKVPPTGTTGSSELAPLAGSPLASGLWQAAVSGHLPSHTTTFRLLVKEVDIQTLVLTFVLSLLPTISGPLAGSTALLSCSLYSPGLLSIHYRTYLPFSYSIPCIYTGTPHTTNVTFNPFRHLGRTNTRQHSTTDNSYPRPDDLNWAHHIRLHAQANKPSSFPSPAVSTPPATTVLPRTTSLSTTTPLPPRPPHLLPPDEILLTSPCFHLLSSVPRPTCCPFILPFFFLPPQSHSRLPSSVTWPETLSKGFPRF
jgi:hypothetical protein